MPSADFNMLLIWSGLVLKIFLIVSVAVLAIYIFVLHSLNFLTKEKASKLIKKRAPGECEDVRFDSEFNFDEETRRIRKLKILWLMIAILSCILYFTYR